MRKYGFRNSAKQFGRESQKIFNFVKSRVSIEVNSLFLGLGKVNRSIAKKISGSKKALIESDGKLCILESLDADDFKVIDEISSDFDAYDFDRDLPANVFISPGVDPRRPFFNRVKDFEIRELDLFCQRFQKPVIAITGTDGKSTFTLQLGEILKRALPQKKIFVGGNLGTAMFEAVDGDYDIAVLETSSFQCERLKSAQVDYGVLLNLSTDHLDRYDSLKDYFAAKWSLLSRSKNIFYPSELDPPFQGRSSLAVYSNEASILEILRAVVAILAKDFHFENRPEFFENLPTLPHRLELYRDLHSQRFFVNDSKATTVHAVKYGYDRMKEKFDNIHLILGGKFKGDEFRILAGNMRKTDRILICGEARDQIYRQIAGAPAPISLFLTLGDALKDALSHLPEGQCVMLSPGCSSYDEFDNFEERGKFFITEIQKIYELERLS